MTTDVSLRDVQEEDLPILFEHQLDKEASQMASFPSRDHDAFMAHWKKIMADESNILKTILFQGNVAGSIFCWDQSGTRKVGYWLGKEYWGKGIASAALAQLVEQVQTRPLQAHVSKQNGASIRVLQKSGFTIVGEETFECADGRNGEEYIMQLDAQNAAGRE